MKLAISHPYCHRHLEKSMFSYLVDGIACGCSPGVSSLDKIGRGRITGSGMGWNRSNRISQEKHNIVQSIIIIVISFIIYVKPKRYQNVIVRTCHNMSQHKLQRCHISCFQVAGGTGAAGGAENFLVAGAGAASGGSLEHKGINPISKGITWHGITWYYMVLHGITIQYQII